MQCNHAAKRLRDHQDGRCWEIIDSHVPPIYPIGYSSSRPSNYKQLEMAVLAYSLHAPAEDAPPWTWPASEHAWSEFLHEFFYWRLADFFTEPPPDSFELQYQVMLAGSAEFLCLRFDLDLPAWIEDPRYHMPRLWTLWGELTPEPFGNRSRRCQRAAPEFLKRNLVFESRNLITL